MMITFKLYDHSTDTEYATDYMLKYKIGAVEYITVNFNSYIPKIKIETTPYQTLEDAVAAAQDGQTISVLRDIVDKGVIINKNITIDFGGFTYNIKEGVGSADAEHDGFLIQKNCTVALKNGSLNVNDDDANKLNVLIHNYADLTVTDMTLDGKFLDLSTADASYVISNKSGTVNLVGNTNIYANDEGTAFALDACDNTADGNPIPHVTLNTTGTIKGAVEVTASLDIIALGDNSEISYIALNGNGQLNHYPGFATTIKRNIVGHPIPNGSVNYADGWFSISSPIIGSVSHENVTNLCHLADENGVTVMPVYFDMKDEVAMKEQIQTVISKRKISVNALVNNAGICEIKLFLMTSLSAIRETFDINLFSHMRLTQLLLKRMPEGSSIVNVAST